MSNERATSHRTAFLLACPGWSTPPDAFVAHYYDVDGVSLCHQWGAGNTQLLPRKEHAGRKCRRCIDVLRSRERA